MAEPKTEQEPSIEEILESIRQIISDDTEAAPATAGPDLSPKKVVEPVQTLSFAQEKAIADDNDVVLDLVDVVPEQSADTDIEIDLREISTPEPEQPVVDLTPAQEGMSRMPDQTAIQTDTDILSENTADAATAAMARLLASNVAIEKDEPARVGRVTLEDLTREMLRPMIKTWLDQNLPRVIEKIVAREVEKLARRALDQ